MSFKDWLFGKQETDNFSIVDSNYISNTPSELIDTSSDSYTVPKSIYSELNKNLEVMKVIYNASINSDIVIRDFSFKINDKSFSAFIIYVDGLSDSNLINNYLLKPLMIEKHYVNTIPENLKDYVMSFLIPQNNVKQLTNFNKIASAINSGDCLLFIDTMNVCFDIDVKGFKQRSVDTPSNEIVIKGPQEAFVENIRTNTSLLRRIVNTENLIIENLEIGKISKTKCALCYMNNIANGDLISEVKFRLNNLDVDSLITSGELEQLIEENNDNGIPQLLLTERPDKCAKHLYDGRIVIIVNGNPYALILPVTLFDFLSSPEDTNLRPSFANFLRFLRFISYLITLLLPGIYLAIYSFHQELVPTELLFSIIASRENVPFPIIFEILLLEISFEIIREAGVRVPSPIGSTLSIVGGLIIGDAAVTANIVSPVSVIIVAITGIASFAIPEFSLGFHLRLFRFIFILLGAISGFLGIGIGIFTYICILCNMRSFGIPFTAPLTPTTLSTNVGYVVPSLWKHDNRSSYVAPQKNARQTKISKKWKT